VTPAQIDFEVNMSVDPTKVTPPVEEDTGKTPVVTGDTSTTKSATPPEQPPTKRAPVATSGRVPKRGNIVDYVLKDGYHPGEKRPLIIVKVWGDTPDALINGQVITDNVNDFITAHPGGSGQFWVTSVECDPTGEKQGTWSFAE
jgi:hypothetical protein